MNKKNCIVAQSGGPTAAINASLAGVIDAAISSGNYDTIYGSVNGITGILNNHYLNLTEFVQNNPDNLQMLKQSPAMYLGSCRFKLPSVEEDSATYKQIFDAFDSMNVSAFFYIGGNDSMDTVLKLSAYGASIGSSIRVIGIPKTIDNDLCLTDHTPGFGSAAKYIAASMLEIAHDTFIYNCKSVTIVEIMGRDAGWLTASSVLARNSYSRVPHLIYLPEVPFSKEQFLEDVKAELATKNNVVIAVSEGIRDKDGNYISASDGALDNFGHAQLNGAGKTLEYLINDSLGVKVRSVEVNILQRCAEHLASKTDLDESFACGQNAVKFADAGITGSMVTMQRAVSAPYTITYEAAPIENIANKVKSVPLEWIAESKNNVTDEIIEYLSPLIQGEISVPFKNGLPVYPDISHLVR